MINAFKFCYKLKKYIITMTIQKLRNRGRSLLPKGTKNICYIDLFRNENL
jgi:hypothetical protein